MSGAADERLARLLRGLSLLPDKPEETAASTLAALRHAAAGAPLSAERALGVPPPPLDADAERQLDALIERRLAGVPLAHLTGRQAFLGLELLAEPAALVPRRETELLGRAAVALAGELAASSPAPITVIDVCTGSGNLAVAVAAAVPSARVFGGDLSAAAIDLARRNAERLGLAARVAFRDGDLLEPFDAPEFLDAVDLLLCNPPYISSAKVAQMDDEIAAHEPRLAFDGGPLGVNLLMRLLQEAPRYLRMGGWLGFEVGLGQGPAMVRRLRAGPYAEVRELANASGALRALLARRR
ncbi:MAG: peptide chain release factor N(5)-glutamine methyltransferase [Dokdonella sp.]